MYLKKVHNTTVRINDDDLIGILDRYDLENYVIMKTVNGETAYKNRTKCPLCEKYYHKNCLGCPFKTFETVKYNEIVYGCEAALQLMTGLNSNYANCNMDEVVFYGYNKDKIVGIINQMYEFFASFKYI